MATNQFTIYTSSDPFGPGPIFNATGSLITILDACLVNGYGTGSYFKPAAGWTKPFPNSGSNSLSNSYAAYTQGTGSGFTMFVNNSGATSAANATEVSVTGWEVLTSMCGPVSASLNVGVGLGQFPLPAQLLTTGRVIWRLSQGTAPNVPRPWIIVADAATIYIWVQTGDSVAFGVINYYHGAFGDCFSLAGTSDKWNCFIYGRTHDNTALTNGADSDYTSNITSGVQLAQQNQGTIAFPGHYIARNAFGGGTSLPFNRHGDTEIAEKSQGVTSCWPCQIGGCLACPNPGDNSFYMCPLYLVEPSSNPVMRGRFRGMYQVGHSVLNFSDGQSFSGSNDYAGKSFMIVKCSSDGGFWAIETTPTLEFN